MNLKEYQDTCMELAQKNAALAHSLEALEKEYSRCTNDLSILKENDTAKNDKINSLQVL